MSSFNPQEERQLAREFVLHYLKDDGVFVLRLLSLNSSDLVVTEVINQLWIRYKTANRLYSTSQHQNSNQILSNETNPNTSTLPPHPTYQNGNTSYRQRTSRIPPPPLPTFLHRTIPQQSENILDSSKSSKDTDV
jgi:hypothetical protein